MPFSVTLLCSRCTLNRRAERSCWCGLQIASDGLKGRVFDVSLADLQKVRTFLHCKRKDTALLQSSVFI